MAILYPQIANAINPSTMMLSAAPAGMMSESAAGASPVGNLAAGPVARPSRMPSRQEVEAFLDQMSSRGEAAMGYEMGPPPVRMKEGGLAGDARRVQQRGRYGDTMLVHMNPDEYDAMVALGGLGGLVNNGVTVNPQTGLPEMFKLMDYLPAIVGIAGAAFGLPTWAVALGQGATTAVTTGDIGKGILSGLGSYALGSLFSDIGVSGVDPAGATGAGAPGAGLSPPPIPGHAGAVVAPTAGWGLTAPMTMTPTVATARPTFEAIARQQMQDSASYNPNMLPGAKSNLYQQTVFNNADLTSALGRPDQTASRGPSKLELFSGGLDKIGQPGGVGYFDVASKGLGGLAYTAGGMGMFDPEPVDYGAYRPMDGRRSYNSEPVKPLNRQRLYPSAAYRPGFDPAFSYFAADSPAAVTGATVPTMRMANGGVPEEMAMAGLMDVSSDEVRNNLEERMSVPSTVGEPQNVEERIVYDNAMLAVQGVLEAEAAQQAIDEFIEVFGYSAYQFLMQLANAPREEGGVVKPANGKTTVADGAIQGEDIIAGTIVDPKTGKKSANLRVGENEYVEPAESLVRRAKAAGLAPTPKNGAMVRSAEEEKLEAAYG